MLNDENFTASLDWEHVDDDDDPDDDDDEDALASHDMGHGSHPSSIIWRHPTKSPHKPRLFSALLFITAVNYCAMRMMILATH